MLFQKNVLKKYIPALQDVEWGGAWLQYQSYFLNLWIDGGGNKNSNEFVIIYNNGTGII